MTYTHIFYFSVSLALLHIHTETHELAQIYSATGRDENKISDFKIYDRYRRIDKKVWKIARNNGSLSHIAFILKSAFSCIVLASTVPGTFSLCLCLSLSFTYSFPKAF